MKKLNEEGIVTIIMLIVMTILIITSLYFTHTEKMEQYKLMELNCTKSKLLNALKE